MSQFYLNSSGGGGGGVTSITGNSGTAATGAIMLETANATPKFVSSPSNVTLDFGLSNLVLGSSIPTLTSGTFNVGLGQLVFNSITSAVDSVGIGYRSLFGLTSGETNIAVGALSAQSLTTGSGNVTIGFNSGPQSNGSNNTIIGTQAGSNFAGSSNIIIGQEAGHLYTGTETGNIIIGNNGVLGESNTIRIGSGLTACYISGITGVTVSNQEFVTINSSTGQLGVTAAPGGGELVAAGELTNSQIKNLHGTPIQIIAAPGSGNVIELITGCCTLNYGGNNAFTASSAQEIDCYYGTSGDAGNILGNAILTETSSYIQYGAFTKVYVNQLPYSTVVNTAINLYNPVATEISGNASDDNTISYNIVYRIITIP
jgi:hypothetical protein